MAQRASKRQRRSHHSAAITCAAVTSPLVSVSSFRLSAQARAPRAPAAHQRPWEAIDVLRRRVPKSDALPVCRFLISLRTCSFPRACPARIRSKRQPQRHPRLQSTMLQRGSRRTTLRRQCDDLCRPVTHPRKAAALRAERATCATRAALVITHVQSLVTELLPRSQADAAEDGLQGDAGGIGDSPQAPLQQVGGNGDDDGSSEQMQGLEGRAAADIGRGIGRGQEGAGGAMAAAAAFADNSNDDDDDAPDAEGARRPCSFVTASVPECGRERASRPCALSLSRFHSRGGPCRAPKAPVHSSLSLPSPVRCGAAMALAESMLAGADAGRRASAAGRAPDVLPTTISQSPFQTSRGDSSPLQGGQGADGSVQPAHSEMTRPQQDQIAPAEEPSAYGVPQQAVPPSEGSGPQAPSAPAPGSPAAVGGGGAAAGAQVAVAGDLDPSEVVLRVQVCRPKGDPRRSQVREAWWWRWEEPFCVAILALRPCWLFL